MVYGAPMARSAVARRRWGTGRGLTIVAACAAIVTLVPGSSVNAAQDGGDRERRGTARDRAALERGCGVNADEAERGPDAQPAMPGVLAVIEALRDPASIEDLETSYRLRVDLRYDEARLRIRERIDLCNGSDRLVPSVHLSVLARAFEEMRVEEVRVDGRRVTVSYPNSADMLVPLGRGLAPGVSTVIDLDFVLEPKRSLRTSLHESLSRSGGMLRVSDWFALVSDGHGLRLPGDSQVSAAARRITLDLRLDRRLEVAAPGTPVRQDPRRHVYTIKDARDYAFLVAPRLRT